MPAFYIAGMLIASLGLGFFGMVSYAMVGDCIDNYYIKHGERADGTIYAIYCFTRALGVAVTGSTSAWMLSGIGYDNQAVVQTESVSQAVFNITVLTPLAFMAVAFIVLVFTYPLSKAKVESNVAKIKELQEKIPEENE